jgi:hypothetical protein
MKYLVLIVVASCFLSIRLGAQLVSEMVEYCPAPGQLINTEGAGSVKAANSVVGATEGMVSLGAFGGYAVYKFAQPVKNDRTNPYGVDFVIFGNPQPDWAEPGIVLVMKDANNNGNADDTWYELAGSEYFFSTTKQHSVVTYYNPLFTGGTDVPWVSAESGTGLVYSNNFHKQDFYPSEEFFGGKVSESVEFTNTRISDQIDLSSPALVKSYHRRFGYADNNLRKSTDINSPDNPYTAAIEGCGGDAMDINWAVDESGSYVNLDQIDFVKISTSVLANAGWCGEISTEICGIADVAPNASLNGPNKCVVINRLADKLFSGDSVQLEAVAFENGRRVDTKINWTTSNGQVAAIETNGLIITKNSGVVNVTASFVNDPSINASIQFNVITPVQIKIDIDSPVLRIDEETEVKIQVYDASGAPVNGLKISINIQNKQVLSLIEKNGRYYARGLSEGVTTIDVFLAERPVIKTSVTVSVLPESSQKEVFVTVKDDYSTWVPREKFNVNSFNLNPFVDRATGDYNLNQISAVTVAHAIASVFKQQGLGDDFRFRDDEKGNGNLYAWRVPKGNEANIEFIYGYGGFSTNKSYAKCWIVLLNNKQLINGFDQHQLKNGDELILYHVADISAEWRVSCFIPNKNEVSVNDTVEVYSTELTCALSAEGKVQIKSSTPIQNQQVWVNNEAAWFNGGKVITDETGTAALRFMEPGIQKISTGIDEMVVNVAHPLSAHHFSEIEKVKIWPQPAKGIVNIETDTHSIENLRIFDLSGHSVLINPTTRGNKVEIATGGLTPGLYILQLTTNNGITSHKIILQ